MKFLNLKKKKIFLVLYISILVFSSLGTINTFYKSTDIESTLSSNVGNDGIFTYTENGLKYFAEFLTKEKVELMKKQIRITDSSKSSDQIINGMGTGAESLTEEALEKTVGQIMILNVIKDPNNPVDSKAAYDLSSEIYFPPVRSQGSQGSCTSWASVYYSMGYLEAKDYGWDASSGNNAYLLSPAWSYNKLTYEGSGTHHIETGLLLEEWGAATWETIPYTDTDYTNWGDESAWREAPLHRPLQFNWLSYLGDPTITTIKNLVEGGTPVTFNIDANGYDQGFVDNFIISSAEYSSSTINHANCIVGFDDSIADDGDVGAFRVVNSWGDSWGESGFYWLTYETLKEIGVLGDGYIQIGCYDDRIDYHPSLVTTWEFSTCPTRMNDIVTLGVGPYGSPLNTLNPKYQEHTTALFPSFMALDISEFQSYYDSNNDVSFYLELGSSNTPGIISSFRIERYISGVLQEITPESPDVPKTTPGYVICTFMDLDHELKVSLEYPTDCEIGNTYTINATVTNTGINDEINVDLFLYLDDILVDSITISSLLVGASETINYMWLPTEYGTYNFTAYAPPVPDETNIGNNIATELLSIRETKLFDGMFVSYIWTIFGEVKPSDFTYSYVSGDIFHVDWYMDEGGSPSHMYWDVDSQTRIMENSGGDGWQFGDGVHTPIWIFTDVSLGDEILIAADAEGDHLFSVAGELIYDLPGFGLIEVWELEDLTTPGGIVWYEKSTGILLNGTFYYAGGAGWYTFDFIDTNVEFTYISFDHEISVSLEVPTNPEIGNTYTINATVINNGENDEINVDLFLYLDEVIVNSITISSLPIGASETINYMWTPTEYKTYNFTAYAPPVLGETHIENNIATELIPIVDTKLFDGMLTDYTFLYIDEWIGSSHFLYSYVSGTIFQGDYWIYLDDEGYNYHCLLPE